MLGQMRPIVVVRSAVLLPLVMPRSPLLLLLLLLLLPHRQHHQPISGLQRHHRAGPLMRQP